jgi:predicted peroxiredoxin
LFFQNHAESQQITASLGGGVKDPSGAAIPGAKVTVRNTATNYDITLETSSEGAFLAPALQPGGPYEVTVEAAGFKKVHQGGITLQVDQSARLELVMEIGAVAETIEVSGSATLLETVSSSGGQVVVNRSIINLPLNQRNPYMLVMLVPGVNGNIGFQYNNVNFSVNGGRPGSNEILLDGIPSSPPLVNSIQGFAVFPSVEAVLEFKVQSNNYSAEFGRSGGSVVNLIFRSV